MRIGQTSIVFFISKLGSSLLGFLAMVYFARLLGSETLGVYFLVLAVLTWLEFVGTIGVSKAVVKRVSEGGDKGEYVTAGLALHLVAFAILSAGVYLARRPLERYVGASVIEFIVVILVANLFFSFLGSILKGNQRVHTYAVLTIFNQVSRRVLQVAIVLLGAASVVGLLTGYVLGTGLAIVVGIYLLSIGAARPRKRHFASLFSYAKYSWLGSFQTKTFSWMDTIVLGFFVSASLIGIYEIAWNVASFMAIFSVSISQTLFPEISNVSSDEEYEKVAGFLQDGLTYCGLFLVPGFLGSILLGEHVLAIYGEEFTRGLTVLVLLVFGRLLYAYRRQFVTTLDSIDRPDLTFRVNLLFISSNVVLNAVLVYQYSWVGAAVATIISSALTLLLSFRYVTRLLSFDLPWAEIGRQWLAGGVMAGVVFALRQAVIASDRVLSIPVALVLIGVGAGTYFAALMLISTDFRTTVRTNLPFDVPVL